MLLNTYTDSIDFNAVTGWVHDTLNAWLPSWGATLVECVLIERKVWPFSSADWGRTG